MTNNSVTLVTTTCLNTLLANTASGEKCFCLVPAQVQCCTLATNYREREREGETERERGRERERDTATDTDTWFIVKATDPYTNAGGLGGGDIKNKIKKIHKQGEKKMRKKIASTVHNISSY